MRAPISGVLIGVLLWSVGIARVELETPTHPSAMTKASSRLYFLKILKSQVLNHTNFCLACLDPIRPIIDSALLFGITVWPRPRPSHWKPFNAGHLESSTHPQSGCLMRSHLASSSSPLSTTNKFFSTILTLFLSLRLLPTLRDSILSVRPSVRLSIRPWRSGIR